MVDASTVCAADGTEEEEGMDAGVMLAYIWVERPRNLTGSQ